MPDSREELPTSAEARAARRFHRIATIAVTAGTAAVAVGMITVAAGTAAVAAGTIVVGAAATKLMQMNRDEEPRTGPHSHEPPTGPLGHGGCTNVRMDNFRRYSTSEHGLIGISCKRCSMEWARAKFVLPQYRGGEMLFVEGEKLYVIERPDNESVPMFLTIIGVSNFRDLFSDLTAGDHIKYRMKQPGDIYRLWRALTGDAIMNRTPEDLYHHAIVEDVQKVYGSSDIVTLIHWQGDGDQLNGSSFISGSGSARIHRDIIHDMASRADMIYRCDYRKDLVHEDNRVLTLARAKAWVGERKGYNLTQNNCEHFAFFCKTGLWQSEQGEFWANKILDFTRSLYDRNEYQDTIVKAFSDLSPGYHIIMFMTVLHPRCHMIVKSINRASRMVTVVRFTIERNIIEESLEFRHPCKIVTGRKMYEPQVVLERANTALENGPGQIHNILEFNCKHFAFLISHGDRR